jgi:hypothetical protein
MILKAIFKQTLLLNNINEHTGTTIHIHRVDLTMINNANVYYNIYTLERVDDDEPAVVLVHVGKKKNDISASSVHRSINRFAIIFQLFFFLNDLHVKC